MNITVNDLESNSTLDQNAMTTLLGGAAWRTYSRRSHTHNRGCRWGSWKKFGFGKVRYGKCYRVVHITLKQCKRVRQFRLGL